MKLFRKGPENALYSSPFLLLASELPDTLISLTRLKDYLSSFMGKG